MPYWLAVVGILLLPLAGQWGFLVDGIAWMKGETAIYAIGVGTEEWAHRLVFLVAFLVIAAFLWATDRWLALIVAMAGCQTFVLGPKAITGYLGLGVGMVVLMRRAPGALRARAVALLAWFGVAQALLVIAQRLKGLDGVGSFGVSGLAACWIAACGLLLPDEIRWRESRGVRVGAVVIALALVGAAVTLTESRAGLAAFLVGLGVRYAPSPGLLLAALALVALVAAGYAIWRTTPHARNSVDARVNLHALTLRTWARSAPTIIVGHGLGSFAQHAEAMQHDQMRELGQNPANPKYSYAVHDDLLHWLYETGLAGMICLAGWFVRWRRRLLAPPLAPAFAVFAVMALAWFPFHDLRTGFLAAGLVGLGSPMNEGA